MSRPETADILAVTLLLAVAMGAAGFGSPGGETRAWSGSHDVLERQTAAAQVSEVWISQNVLRVTDPAGQVVCHVAALSEGAGIACLPSRQTALRLTVLDEPSALPPSTEQFVSRNVFRVLDRGANVVCYGATLSEGAGVDCLPLAETTFQQVANRSELAFERPTDAYVLGSRTDVGGVAPAGVDAVALYVRAADGWSLLDVDEDGILSTADVLNVTDGRWGRQGVVLSNTSDAITTAGEYELGVVASSAALDSNGTLRPTLPPGAFANATSETVALTVQPPAVTDPVVFQDVGDQVAVEDGLVTVRGLATGTREALVVVVDARGQIATEVTAVDRDGVFEEEFPLFTADGRVLSKGVAVGLVLSPGRDGMVGDGEVGNRLIGDLAAYESYLYDLTQSLRLTQQQILDRIEAETVGDSGSDDLRVVDTFLLTDARTTIESVTSANATAGVDAGTVTVGERLVVRGETNRKPDDNTIFVDLLDPETGARAALATADEWGLDGDWTVTLPTTGLDPGNYTVVAEDGDSADRVTVRLVPAGASPALPDGAGRTGAVPPAASSLSVSSE